MEYRIQLEAYAGPLDLLLHLVRRNEIDLHDIPIAELTDQYLAHLQLIRELDMDQAGEFLVMAATLLEIKSQMILPPPETDEPESQQTPQGEPSDQSDASDPRYELVQQLLAYKRYKDAARRLERQQEQWNARFPVRPIGRARPGRPEADDSEAEPRDVELEDVNVMELCEAFGRLLSSIGELTGHAVTDDDTPIGLHAEDIADRLGREGPMTLRQICQGRTRGEMVGLFLAMLELVRDKRVSVEQAEPGGEVSLVICENAAGDDVDEDESADWRDSETGEMQYDWPDEQARRRYERRQSHRQRRLEEGEFASDPQEQKLRDDEIDQHEEYDWDEPPQHPDDLDADDLDDLDDDDDDDDDDESDAPDRPHRPD